MSEAEVDKLLTVQMSQIKLKKWDKAMIEMLYATGMRISELVNLKMTDVDMKRCVVKVFGKGSKERLVPLEKQSDFETYLNEREQLHQRKFFFPSEEKKD